MKFKYSLIFLGALIDCSLKADMPAPRNFSNTKHYREIGTKAEFDAILSSPRPQVVKFYTEVCGACKTMEPVFNSVAKQNNSDVGFSAVNLDKVPFKDEIITQYKLVAVPTTVFLKSGKEIKQEQGSMSEDDLKSQVSNFVRTSQRTTSQNGFGQISSGSMTTSKSTKTNGFQYRPIPAMAA